MSQATEIPRRAPLVRLRKRLQNELIPATQCFINEAATTPGYYFVLLTERIRSQVLQPAQALVDESCRGAADRIIDDAEACIRELEAASQAAQKRAEVVEQSIAGGTVDNIPSKRSERAREESDASAMQRFIAEIFPQPRKAADVRLNAKVQPTQQQGPRTQGLNTGKPVNLFRFGDLSSYRGPRRPATTTTSLVEPPRWRPDMKPEERAMFRQWLDTREKQIPLQKSPEYIPMFVRNSSLQQRRPLGNFRFQPLSNKKPSIRTSLPPIISNTLGDQGNSISGSPFTTSLFSRDLQSSPWPIGITPSMPESIQRSSLIDAVNKADFSLDNSSKSMSENVNKNKEKDVKAPLLSSNTMATLIIYGLIFVLLRLPATVLWKSFLELMETLTAGKLHSTLYIALAALAMCKQVGLDPANSLCVLLVTAFVPLGSSWTLDSLFVLTAWAWHRCHVMNIVATSFTILRWRDALCLFGICCFAFGGRS